MNLPLQAQLTNKANSLVSFWKNSFLLHTLHFLDFLDYVLYAEYSSNILTHSNQFQTENELHSGRRYVADIPLCSLHWSLVPGLSANHEKYKLTTIADYFMLNKQ